MNVPSTETPPAWTYEVKIRFVLLTTFSIVWENTSFPFAGAPY